MGNQVSKLHYDSKERDSRAREQLDILTKLADARLDTFEAELKSIFLNQESVPKRSVPEKQALRFERSIRVDTSSEVTAPLIACRCGSSAS